jgi:uncharacterized protein (UPF0305 family)
MLITEFFNDYSSHINEESITKQEFLDKRDQLFKRLSTETDPKNKEFIRQQIKQLELKYPVFLPKDQN